jgi:hypothetical protein
MRLPTMEDARDTPRRRSPRLPLRLEARLLGRATRDVTIVDLSETGCLARCPAALDHGAILDLSVPLEDEPLFVKVRVTEASLDGESRPEEPQYLTGLQFLGPSPKDAARLRRLLDDERRRRSADATAL